jgi:hypothetical protein
MQHTKEPWRIDQYGDIRDSGQRQIYLSGFRTSMVSGAENDDQKANTRRIVACVNACEGIPTEELESCKNTGLIRTVRAKVAAERQRDELLQALEYHQAQTRPIQQTIEVIAKVKGQP